MELSPSVRKGVGELEPLCKQLDDKSTEFSRLSKQRSNLQFITLAIAAVGMVFALAGFALWATRNSGHHNSEEQPYSHS